MVENRKQGTQDKYRNSMMAHGLEKLAFGLRRSPVAAEQIRNTP
jgi:hypothetical protein